MMYRSRNAEPHLCWNALRQRPRFSEPQNINDFRRASKGEAWPERDSRPAQTRPRRGAVLVFARRESAVLKRARLYAGREPTLFRPAISFEFGAARGDAHIRGGGSSRCVTGIVENRCQRFPDWLPGNKCIGPNQRAALATPVACAARLIS
jgi:hypothetical protein